MTIDKSADELTAREYACITLGVPQTGCPDLDAVIREGERRRVAAMAMQGLTSDNQSVANSANAFGDDMATNAIAVAAVGFADALLTALDTQEGE